MMDKAEFMELAVADVIPTGDNPRQVNEESERFAQLADSVAAEGVKEPVRVRPHPELAGKYDLRDGARRLRAAQLAERETIPALVYAAMTDAEAFEMTFMPFFGREDLTPIEEAKAVSIFLAKCGGDVDTVAARLGQTPRWVRLRVNVFDNLARCWMDRHTDAGDDLDLTKWSIRHFELVARFDKTTQQRLCDGMTYEREQATPAELNLWCHQQLRLLKAAPWDLDELLADPDGEVLVTCRHCSKRTGCERLLWDDIEVDPDDDRCLDAACFEVKRRATIRKKIDQARAQHPNLVLVATAAAGESLGYDARRDLKAVYPGVDFADHWTAAKKTDPAAVPCLVLAGKAAGKIRWRKRAHSKPPTWNVAADPYQEYTPGGEVPAAGKTLAEKREELGCKRWAAAIEALAAAVGGCDLDDIAHDGKSSILFALIGMLGTRNWYGSTVADADTADKLKELNDIMADRPAVLPTLLDIQRDIWSKGVRPQVLELLRYNGPITRTPETLIQVAGQVARLLGIDLDALFEKACRARTEPKSWSKGAPQQARGAD